jgi:predicted glycosyl hydrolase (DUF1957 family)
MLKILKATKYDVLDCILSTKYVDFSSPFSIKNQQPSQKSFYSTEIIYYNFYIDARHIAGIKSA